MNFNEFYFAEMLVIGQPKNEKYIIAFDKWIYVLDDEPNQEVFLEILNKLGLKETDKFDLEDTYSFITNIQEYVGDVLIGQIQKKNLYLYDYGTFKSDPKSSVLVKKVVNQLKLNSATYIEDTDSTETKVSKKKMTMQVPDIAYHGTTMKYLSSILSKGLKASESDTNYEKQGIYHDDLIFFATRIGEAMHHALHTASEKGGVPIIIELTIPDKDQIIADYDVEKMSNKDLYYGDTGEREKFQSKSYQQDPNKLSKHFGVYGYKQRIPASFIKAVWVAQKPVDELYSIKDFKKMKPKTVLKYYHLGYFD
jgi:hypothetical protein